MTEPLERWRRALVARTIPPAILEAAPEPPYGFPAGLFRRRAERAATRSTPTSERALEALPDGGVVLDVGCGAGATSAALAARASLVIGVDGSGEMLAAFRMTVGDAGTEIETIHGAWPDVAPATPVADVAVCGHVLYNVDDLAPFVAALTAHARRRVVIELTGRHPQAWTNDLWERFHGVRFPDGPTVDDAEAALRSIGVDPARSDRIDEDHAGFERRDDAVALVRRRLCLPAGRDPEIAEALGDRLAETDGGWAAGPAAQRVTTLWWDGGA